MKQRKMISVMLVFCMLILLLSDSIFAGSASHTSVSGLNDKKFGVFIGLDQEELKETGGKIDKYKTIVIDGQSFSKSQIRKWKSDGHIVYSYLNIGSISTSRSYYKDFKNIKLKAYNHWPGEYWMDVSKKAWQKKMIEVEKSLTDKGVDGLFIDNTDVYYQYHKNSIYSGLENIISGLRKYTSRIIINGGDVFVKKLMDRGKIKLIYGVNQESVFSRIVDYEKNIFKKQTKYNRTYYQKYLKRCKKAGLKVYVIEYTKDYALAKSIKSYCKKAGYRYYMTSNINLE